MQTFKRILAVIVMVISVLVLVVCLTGVAGTWIVRGQLNTSLVGIVTAAETRATTVKQGLDRLDAVLIQARSRVTAMEHEAQALGTSVEENRPLLTAISDTIGVELSPLVESGRAIITTVREAAAAVNGAIEAINAIPFVSVPTPELQTLQRVSQDVEDFRTEVQAVRTAIEQRRSEIIEGAVSIVTTPIAQIGGALDEMSDTVSGYSQQVGAVQEGLSSFKSAVGRTLTWVAVLLTLILLWLALSQAGLFVLGWRAFAGQDLLPKKKQETASDD